MLVVAVVTLKEVLVVMEDLVLVVMDNLEVLFQDRMEWMVEVVEEEVPTLIHTVNIVVVMVEMGRLLLEDPHKLMVLVEI
tara:strand:+ start:161 stop:400 length:240 start_codon:yes stop_codon:yes gene_type:complete